MTTFEEGTMSLCFKDFARFLMCVVFSLNHQQLQGSSMGCYVVQTPPSGATIQWTPKNSSSPTPARVKTCSQFSDPLARSMQVAAPSLKGLRKKLKAFWQSFPPSQTWQNPLYAPKGQQMHHSAVPYHGGLDVWGRRSGWIQFTSCGEVQYQLVCCVQTVLRFEQQHWKNCLLYQKISFILQLCFHFLQ